MRVRDHAPLSLKAVSFKLSSFENLIFTSSASRHWRDTHLLCHIPVMRRLRCKCATYAVFRLPTFPPNLHEFSWIRKIAPLQPITTATRHAKTASARGAIQSVISSCALPITNRRYSRLPVGATLLQSSVVLYSAALLANTAAPNGRTPSRWSCSTGPSLHSSAANPLHLPSLCRGRRQGCSSAIATASPCGPRAS